MHMSGDTLELRDLIRNVSIHLDGLAAEVHTIEHAIGDEFDRNRELEDGQIKRLQRLDYLRQSLEDLALLNLFIADVCKGELGPTVGQRLKLAATRGLLSRESEPTSFIAMEECVGEVDLF